MAVNENKVGLLLGGNQGDVARTFEKVRVQLARHFELTGVSSLYKTDAWGMENAPDFLNQVILIRTQFSAQQVFAVTQKIEKELGRERGGSHGEYKDRTIDIDILSFNEEIIETNNLQIPHPRLHQRNFTLVPMLEVMPDWVHPVIKKNVKDLLELTADTKQVTKV